MKSVAVLSILCALALGACSRSPEKIPEAAVPAAESASVAAKLEVTAPWAAITPVGAKVGAGYLTLTNPGPADKLLSVASPRAKRVEVHEMKMEGAMMSMRPVETLDIPAGATVALSPGGYHLMFIDIAGPFTEGQSIPLTLTFEKAGAVETALVVSKSAPAGAAADGLGMKMEGH